MRVTTVLLLLMALIWGVNFSVVKFGTQSLPPLAYNGLRVMLAAVTLVAVAGMGAARWPSRRSVLALLGLGVLGNGLYQVLFIEGISRTRAGTAALVFAASPALIAIVGRLLRVERVSSRGWAGIALQLLGMTLVVLTGEDAVASGGSSFLGNMLILSGSVCWALFTVLLKRYTHDVDPLQLSALTMVGGAVPLAVVSAPALTRVVWSAVPGAVWAAIAYSGLFALVLAYLFWYRGIRVVGPTRTAMFGNLQPIIALGVAWAWPTLREVPTVWQGAGAALIVSGLLLGRPRT
jgi:drug/metabolite transporter (DMT)-like permease